MRIIGFVYFIGLLFFPKIGITQEENTAPKWELNGYIKDLQSLFVLHQEDPITGDIQSTVLQDNLLHNRLNVSYFYNEKNTMKVELRNRIFWGDQIRLAGADAYKANLNQANDYFNLSLSGFDDTGIGVHSMIDRLYWEYSYEKWEIRLGRQRINWGINTVWNPNDIFNAYSFTDFDYEERPGSDAIRIKRYTGDVSSLEFAAKITDNLDSGTVAMLWKPNKWNYDFQFLAGIAQGDYVLGGGWAGAIKNVGFKGEFTSFFPIKNEGKRAFAATLGADYVFGNGLYFNSGFLYNSSGAAAENLSNLFAFQLSAKNLYPFKYSFFEQISFPVSALSTGGVALIYSPSQANALFLNPLITYSIKENWDLDVVGQLAFGRSESKRFGSPVQAVFLRVKWSF